MELLIDLIVWIFHAIAGDEEGKKKPLPPELGGKPGVPTARGPYNYGDNRPVQQPQQSGSARPRPRTLEEILEEVRREQQGKANPAQQPPAQAKTVSTQNDQQRQIERAQRKAAKRAAKQAEAAAAAAQAQPVSQEKRERKSLSTIENREVTSDLERKEIVHPEQIERKFDALKVREEERFKPISEVAELKAVPKKEIAVASRATEAPLPIGSLIAMLREPDRKTRAETARRAMMLSVIFGPPKSRMRMRSRR